MKNILRLTPFLVLILASCATTPVNLVSPPNLNQLETLKKQLELGLMNEIHLSSAEVMAMTYLKAQKLEAKGEIKESCKNYQALSENSAFPLNKVALVHSLKICDYSKRELKNIWNKTSIENYLAEDYFETSRKLAQNLEMKEFEAQHSISLIQFKKINAEKIKLINRAIQIANELKDDEKIKHYKQIQIEISPMFNPEITPTNIYLVAKDFESNRKFSEAQKLYQQIINGDYSLEDKIKSFNAYRMSFKVDRKLKVFLEKTKEMEVFLKAELEKNPEDSKTQEAWVDSKLILVRAIWTDHDSTLAKKLLLELIDSKLGNQNQKANIYLVYGSLLLELKKNILALEAFEQAIQFKISDNSLLENIQWAVVWNNYLLKKYNVLINHVERISKKSSNQNFIAKLNFWKANALLKLNKPDLAKSTFEEIIQSDSFGYYGILSSIKIKSPINPLPKFSPPPEQTGNSTLDWLIGLNEIDLSQKFLKSIDSTFKTYNEREKAMPLYFQTKWYQGGMKQIYNFKTKSRNVMTEKYINVVFPTPYSETISLLSEKYEIPKELIWAITRQESAFVASERSWADAFGLMQMIPEKAVELSRKYQIPYHDYYDLYRPETNLEFGAALLRDLNAKFKGKFAQMVAGYNASESVISTWEKERFNGNYFEFIESIPYEETRNYIKLVFRNYITYKRINSSAPFEISEDFFARNFN